MKANAFPKLLVLFTVIPLLELFVLIKAGELLGTLSTIAIVICTGILGAAFARSQGVTILQKIKATLKTGQIPGNELIQGLLILTGGIMLVTPGFITDFFGFALILPSSRKFIAEIAIAYTKNKLAAGKWSFHKQSGESSGFYGHGTAFYNENLFNDDENDDDPREIIQ